MNQNFDIVLFPSQKICRKIVVKMEVPNQFCEVSICMLGLQLKLTMTTKLLNRLIKYNNDRQECQQFVQAYFKKEKSSQNIINSIKGIYFPYLLELTLRGNQIKSVQTLSQLQSQQIRMINLCSNFIVNIFALRKIQSEQLKEIICCNNVILEGQGLIYSNSCMKILGLEYITNPPQCQDLTFVVKFKIANETPLKLSILSEQRINNACLINCISEKYSKLGSIMTSHDILDSD